MMIANVFRPETGRWQCWRWIPCTSCCKIKVDGTRWMKSGRLWGDQWTPLLWPAPPYLRLTWIMPECLLLLLLYMDHGWVPSITPTTLIMPVLLLLLHGSWLRGCFLQISAFYFLTYEKADRTIFALSVGRLVSRSVSPLIFLLQIECLSDPYWPSTTVYHPVPPSNDPVPPCTN